MGEKTGNVVELESFLAEFVSPHLRAAGFRKSAHTFRRRQPNGDEAAMQFRAWPMARLCSFLFDIWITIEPWWDLRHFNPDRPKPYPARTHTYDATFQRQARMPELDDPWSSHGAFWAFDESASRDQVGHQIQDLVLGHVLADVEVALDRGSLLEAAANKVPILGHTPRSEHLHRALLVDAGPSDELDEVLLALEPNNEQDAQFASWSAARLLDGPTWRALTQDVDREDPQHLG